MTKTFVAALVAISLTFSPVAAQTAPDTSNRDNLATALFALFALGLVGKALSERNDDNDRPEAGLVTRSAPPVVRDTPHRIAPDVGGLRRDDARPWWDESRSDRQISPGRVGRDHDDRPWWQDVPDRQHGNGRDDWQKYNTRALPQSCLTTVRTRTGNQTIFGQACMERRFAEVDHLPRRCEVSLRGPQRMRFGFDPQCLRAAGYTMDRNR